MTALQSFDETTDKTQSPIRLAALRAELAQTGLDGFLIPRSDEHQNEYVPPSEERLAWLTGFAGSSGTAVVLADQASIFVDGRYTVQAGEQVDTASFTVRPVLDEPVDAWIGSVLSAGQKLGYDPRLHTLAEVRRLSAGVAKAGATLVAVDRNPVDAVWADRPAAPLAPVVLHDAALAGESAASKLSRIRAKLAEFKADAVFTNDAHAVAWVFNIRGGDVAHTPLPLSFALIPRDGEPTLFVDGRKLSNEVRARLSSLAAILEPGALDEALAAASKGRRVRLDPNIMAQRFAQVIEGAGGSVQDGSDPIAALRAVKNATEQAGARAAHLRDGVAVTRFLAWLDEAAPRGGVTEISAAEALEGFRHDTGVLKDLSFPSISATGPNAAQPHYRVSRRSNRPIGPGLFLIDSGAQYLDGTTDITRTVAVGEPTALMTDRYTRVLQGHIAIARARFPVGVWGAQLDGFARAALWQAGADFDHGTGHGIGSYLSVHEGPQRISKLGSTPLAAGMLLSNEPGYYRPGEFGIRIENLVLVAPVEIAGAERPMLGFETLTLAPIDIRPIERALLSSEEIAWLDAYHDRVRDSLGGELDARTRAWLDVATRPLGNQPG